MQTGTIIVGQGLSGTWLSYWLLKSGAEFIVIDESKKNSASKVAGGILNPVTGRRMVKTWMAEVLLPFAWENYGALGDFLDVNLIAQTELIDFFASPDRRLSFEKRAQEFESYLNWPQNESIWREYFEYPFGFGIVSPVYQVNLQTMILKWRNYLDGTGRFLDGKYIASGLTIFDNHIEYNSIKADRIIFCDGTAVMEQPFFSLLPFACNKGEALIISAPELPANRLFKKTNTITPWQNGLFWVGSSYDRDYKDDQPTEAFYHYTIKWLKEFLKLPFTVEDHLAAIRPTTVERRPFAGMHPLHKNVGILNGMGTKGVSVAPYLAKQLADYILLHTPILKEADVQQYARILRRS
jgi:glycine/D-amino acid oxidase-like deaminating enzyme